MIQLEITVYDAGEDKVRSPNLKKTGSGQTPGRGRQTCQSCSPPPPPFKKRHRDAHHQRHLPGREYVPISPGFPYMDTTLTPKLQLSQQWA